MSVLELLDTITGAYNNWTDGIKNDDPTFISQIKGAYISSALVWPQEQFSRNSAPMFWREEP